ncbi:hypothetical protein ACOSP7_024299 [Xanthoceras sorbifolium]
MPSAERISRLGSNTCIFSRHLLIGSLSITLDSLAGHGSLSMKISPCTKRSLWIIIFPSLWHYMFSTNLY